MLQQQNEAAAALLAATTTPDHHHVDEEEEENEEELSNGAENGTSRDYSKDFDTDEHIKDPVEERRTLAERNERLHDQLKVSFLAGINPRGGDSVGLCDKIIGVLRRGSKHWCAGRTAWSPLPIVGLNMFLCMAGLHSQSTDKANLSMLLSIVEFQMPLKTRSYQFCRWKIRFS